MSLWSLEISFANLGHFMRAIGHDGKQNKNIRRTI